MSKLGKDHTPENISRLRNGEFDTVSVEMPELRENSVKLPFGMNEEMDASMAEMLELAKGTLAGLGGMGRSAPRRKVQEDM